MTPTSSPTPAAVTKVLLFMTLLTGGASALSDFVTKYEFVKMEKLNVPKTKAVESMQVKKVNRQQETGYRVSFEAYGQKFNLSLAEDPRHIDRVPVFIHDNGGVSKHEYDSDYSIYIGRLEDNPRSEVMGYFRDGIFDGVIRTEHNVFFVEPADNFFMSKQAQYDAVVYSGMEVISPDCITMEGGVRACFQNKTHAYGPSKNVERLKSSDVIAQMSAYDCDCKIMQKLKDATLKTETGNKANLRVCGVELFADHTFVRSRNHNVNVVIQEMILHLHYADLVYRNTDFNLPFRIGLIPEKVTVFVSPNEKGYPMGQDDLSAKDYLASFSFYVQRHCLVVGFSHRPFESNTLGISFVANPDPEGPVGGICELPMRFIDQDTIHSFNIASITTSTSNRKRVPHGVSFGTVTHEIGHSFGSPHDPAADPACHPIGKSGFFIMVKYSVDGSLPNHRAFSPCSVRDMRKVVKAKGTCLTEDGARCGNGIIEPGEECDCGSEATCETLDPCCTPMSNRLDFDSNDINRPSKPPGSSSTDKPCTIRRNTGLTCSPRSSACCNDQCGAMAHPASRNTSCRPFDECMASGVCDEKGVCRALNPRPNGYPCRGTRRTCRDGQCVSTPCKDRGMIDCTCTDQGRFGNNECHICCKNTTSSPCLPAIEFGLKSTDGRLYVQRSDFFCHSRRGQCDGFGVCVVSPMISHSSNIGPSSAASTGHTHCAAAFYLSLIYLLVKHLT